MQAKLLRFLDSGEIKKLGGTGIIYSNVRIIAATNRDLAKMVKEGTFREDLYYRLNIIPVYIPPLRERPDDIEALAEYYLGEYNQKYGKDLKFTPAQMQRLFNYSWPGNVRELRNEIERFVITGGQPSWLMKGSLSPLAKKDEDEPLLCGDLREAREEFEKNYIRQALRENKWRVNKTAEALGIHRSILYSKMEKYNLRAENPRNGK